MCPSHFVESESQALRAKVESKSSKLFSSRVRASHKNCRVTSSPWFASSSQCRVNYHL